MIIQHKKRDRTLLDSGYQWGPQLDKFRGQKTLQEPQRSKMGRDCDRCYVR